MMIGAGSGVVWGGLERYALVGVYMGQRPGGRLTA